MWLLVEYPCGSQALFRLAIRNIDIETLKRSYRKLGMRIAAVYRRKSIEPVTYDSAGIEDR